ncbi:MAG TPA: hypothetical protein QGF02_03770 [Candidatus Babeliales bacterium]|nr:hypothetical protein [Candidatus Babeliales bacterium]
MKKLLLSILILTTASPCLSKTWEAKIKSTLGAVTGAATGLGMREAIKYAYWRDNQSYYSREKYSVFSLEDAPIFNAVLYTTFALTGGYLGKKIGYYFTPDSKYKRAKKLLQSDLLNACFYRSENGDNCYLYDAQYFVENVHVFYAYSKYPLTTAFENLKRLKANLAEARSLLLSTREKETFAQASDYLLNRLASMQEMVLAGCITLKALPEWLEESKAYEVEQARLAQERAARAQERQARAQSDLAFATWMNALRPKDNIYIDNSNRNN